MSLIATAASALLSMFAHDVLVSHVFEFEDIYEDGIPAEFIVPEQ